MATRRGKATAFKGDPRMAIAFPRLSTGQIALLTPFGKLSKYKKGETIWKAGQKDLCMCVVIKGGMDILDGRTNAYVATHRKGSFSGDVDILSGRPSLVHAVAATDLELLKVPAECVRTIVAEQPDLGTLILKAYLMRRAILMEQTNFGLLVFGSRYCPDTLRIREFLARNHIPMVWEDLEASPATDKMLKEFNVLPDETPVVMLMDGTVLSVPTNRDLAVKLGIKRPVEDRIYDLVIVGAGPAGLAAAVYGASEGLSTLLVDSNSPGGQAGTSSRIENYMGFPTGVSGQVLVDSALIQAEKFGARMILPVEVTNITCSPIGGHTLDIEGVGEVQCRCVILAPGASYRKLEVENLQQYESRGVYYSATNVERLLCGEEAVVVVGGGNSAGQAAVYMSEKASHVYLVIRSDDMSKSMSSYLATRISNSDRISVLLNSEVCALEGEDFVHGCVVKDRKKGTSQKIAVSGVFVMIGALPHTNWLPKQIVRDGKGFILTGSQAKSAGSWKLARDPFFLETTCPGVFAAGDARSNSVKRVASAVGEGSMAVALVHQFLAL